MSGYYILNWDAPASKAVRVHFDARTLRQRLVYWLIGAKWFELPAQGGQS